MNPDPAESTPSKPFADHAAQRCGLVAIVGKPTEWTGGHTLPEGNALLGGLYCNELLLRLLARDDPHANLFDSFMQQLQGLWTA